MLPFPKRKANSDEVELNDEDLVLVEEATPRAPATQQAVSSSESHVRPVTLRAAPRGVEIPASVPRAPRGSALPPGSRRVLDEQIEEDVAGQCLASIAAATSVESARHLSSSSHIRAALAVPAAFAVPAVPAPSTGNPSSPPPSSVSRLPSVSPPPFVRTTTATYPLPNDAGASRTRAPEAPGIRDCAPPSAFVRRSSPALHAAQSTFPPPAPSSYGAQAAIDAAPSKSSFGSVAPVSMTAIGHTPHEPTVILVRERPRSIWIVAAAALGAIGAIAAMRFAPAIGGEPSTTTAPPAAVQPPATLQLPSPAVVLPNSTSAPVAVVAPVAPPVAVVAPAPSSRAAAVVHFGDDQGVAIKAPAPGPRKPVGPSTGAPGTPGSPSARPTGQAPRVPSMGAPLPDGSFGLVRGDSTPSAPVTTSPAPAPEPPRKRVLTPEQQLAEAQLKASMK